MPYKPCFKCFSTRNSQSRLYHRKFTQTVLQTQMLDLNHDKHRLVKLSFYLIWGLEIIRKLACSPETLASQKGITYHNTEHGVAETNADIILYFKAQ